MRFSFSFFRLLVFILDFVVLRFWFWNFVIWDSVYTFDGDDKQRFYGGILNLNFGYVIFEVALIPS